MSFCGLREKRTWYKCAIYFETSKPKSACPKATYNYSSRTSTFERSGFEMTMDVSWCFQLEPQGANCRVLWDRML
eukprot:755587-Amphidinium_carterae.1